MAINDFTPPDYRDLFPDYGQSFPTESTRVNNLLYAKAVNSDVLITKGKWRFVIGKVVGEPLSKFTAKDDFAMFIGDKGVVETKRFTIEGVSYHVPTQKVHVIITLHENPIPLFILWGAVAVAVMITGAITANSVLEDVEEVLDKPVTNILNNPTTLAIVGIFLLPLVIKLISTMKRK